MKLKLAKLALVVGPSKMEPLLAWRTWREAGKPVRSTRRETRSGRRVIRSGRRAARSGRRADV